MTPTKNMRRERYIVLVFANLIILGSYWYMADQPNPWMALGLAAAGILAGIGINRYKYRAGHFDRKS